MLIMGNLFLIFPSAATTRFREQLFGVPSHHNVQGSTPPTPNMFQQFAPQPSQAATYPHSLSAPRYSLLLLSLLFLIYDSMAQQAWRPSQPSYTTSIPSATPIQTSAAPTPAVDHDSPHKRMSTQLSTASFLHSPTAEADAGSPYIRSNVRL